MLKPLSPSPRPIQLKPKHHSTPEQKQKERENEFNEVCALIIAKMSYVLQKLATK